MVYQVAAFWIFCYVAFLVEEVFSVADSVFVMAWVPDFAFELFADGVREAAFDELQAAGKGLFRGGSYEYVDMVWHEGESMELVAGLFAVAEENFQHQIGVGCAREQGSALMR